MGKLVEVYTQRYNNYTRIDILKAFLTGRFGRGGAKILMDIDCKIVYVYIEDDEQAGFEVLKDFVSDIRDLLGDDEF